MQSTLCTLLLIVVLIACGPTAAPLSISPATPAPTVTGESTPGDTFAYNYAFGLTPAFEGQVDVAGAHLYLTCFGVGTPTVVLDAGAGMTPDTWKDVVSGIYTHTRTCAFNRAGYGWSSGPVEPRSAQTHAKMLRKLLATAKIEGPYILVGHSIAALSDIVFADKYPEDTAGLVLVDGAHPDQCERRRDALPPESPDDSEDLQAFRSFFIDCDTFWSRITSESGDRWLDSSGDQAREVTSLGDLPLVVLFNGSTSGERGDISPDLIAQLDQTKVNMQGEYADLSTNGSLVVVEDTTHLIQNDQPQVVIDVILRVLQVARGR
ncbi:MAG: alpha/beta hydrolase [Phycisphaerales bacterium]|nr:MAG: alpha/beta hydrolase [Phycisphaerales bacterium]